VVMIAPNQFSLPTILPAWFCCLRRVTSIYSFPTQVIQAGLNSRNLSNAALDFRSVSRLRGGS
jgi:hypothetical protein